MTQIKIGDKTLIIEDGANVEISGDEIRVSPALQETERTTAPQPYFVYPWGWPNTFPVMPTSPFVTQPFPGTTITWTADNPVAGLTVGGGVAPLTVGRDRTQ